MSKAASNAIKAYQDIKASIFKKKKNRENHMLKKGINMLIKQICLNKTWWRG